MNHYFLIASLPLLAFDVKPPMSLDDFLKACEANLSEGDAAVMRDLLETNGAGSDHPFALQWLDRETELRNAMARLRARNQKLSADAWLRPQAGAHVDLQTGVTEAFQAPDPLEREKALDLLRWRILDELAGLNPFSLEAVFSYGLKLRIVRRWADFNRDAGAALLEKAAAGAASGTANTIIMQKAATV
jgi:hypothetical protein